MREPDEVVKAERPGAALDGMNRPEHGVDRLVVAGPFIEGDEAAFEFFKKLLAFLKERFAYFFHLVHESLTRLSRPPRGV